MVPGCGPVVIGERPGGSTDEVGGAMPGEADGVGAGSGGKAGDSEPSRSDGGEGNSDTSASGGQGESSLMACNEPFAVGRRLLQLRRAISPSYYTYTAADVDENGLLDWIVTTEAKLSVIFQEADGFFAPPVDSPFDLVDASAVRATDLNRDGELDLAITDYRGGKVQVFWGDGSGAFEAGDQYQTGGAPVSIEVADLNKDEVPDLIVANQNSSNVQILLGNADGSFQKSKWFNVNYTPTNLVVGDWNRDETLDLAVASFNQNTLTVLLGKGAGDFERLGEFEAGYNASLSSSADMNDDGILDLVVINGGSPSDDERVGVILGHGDGTFDAPSWDYRLASTEFLSDSDDDGVMDSWTKAPQPINGYPFNFADWNGDGAIDMAVLIQEGYAAYIVPGKEDGTFEEDISASFDSGAQSPDGGGPVFTIADATRDGIPDALVATTGNSILVAQGMGDGTFQGENEYPVGAAPSGIFAAHLNGDGWMDLLTTNYGPSPDEGASLSIFIADEEGGYNRSDYAFESAGLHLAIGDLDGNGTLDLVASMPSPESRTSIARTLLGSGDGTFTAGGDLSLEHSAPPKLRDFDGDGILDLVAISFTDALFMLGKGDGTFEPGVPLPVQDLVALEDLNEDGVLDAISIAVDEYNSPAWLAVALGNGDGTFGPERPEVPYYDYPLAIIARDFDSDGHVDLAVDNLILRGEGDGSFSCGEYRLLKNSLLVDLNNDDLDDVVRAEPYISSTRIESFLSSAD